MTNSEKKSLYMKQRRRVQAIIRRLENAGHLVNFEVPALVKKPKMSDIRELEAIKPITIQKETTVLVEDKELGVVGVNYRDWVNIYKRSPKSTSGKLKLAKELEKKLAKSYKESGIAMKTFSKSAKINEKNIDRYLEKLKKRVTARTPEGTLISVVRKREVRIENAVALLDEFGAGELSEELADFASSHDFRLTHALITELEGIVEVNLWDSDQDAKAVSEDMEEEAKLKIGWYKTNKKWLIKEKSIKLAEL